MQNFLLQLRSRGGAPAAAPRRRRQRSGESRSRSSSPEIVGGDKGDTSLPAVGGVMGSSRSTGVVGPKIVGGDNTALLRSRNPHQHRAESGSAAVAATSASPSYVIRPLPWMSPTHQTMGGGGGGGGFDGTQLNNNGTSYLWAGHYSSRTTSHWYPQRTHHRHPRAGSSSMGMLWKRWLPRRCRQLSPGAVALICGLSGCVGIALLYKLVSLIVGAVVDSRRNGFGDRTYYHYYSSFQPLDGLNFQEWTVRGTSAVAHLDRDVERAHRFELLRRGPVLLPRQRHGSVEAEKDENDPTVTSYMEHRQQVLQKIVPKWLHRNDVKLSSAKDEETGGGGGEEGDNPGTAAEEKRKLETSSFEGRNAIPGSSNEAKRTMITLSNMEQHHGNSCPGQSNVADIRTTLVIQASPDRMWILNETCQRWRDPIVVVVGVVENATDPAAPSTDEAMVPHSTAWNRTLLSLRQSCPHLTLLQHEITSDPVLYPVNLLRNVALDAVTTSHILVMDADFVPSTNLHETIRNVLQDQRNIRTNDESGDYVALVVPAFERVDHPPCPTPEDCRSHLLQNSSYIPPTFEELQTCVSDKNCQVFQLENNWPGHHSTRSGEWLQRQWYEDDTHNVSGGSASSSATTPRIRQVPCFHSLRYEPYVVISWCGNGGSSSAPGKDNPQLSSPLLIPRAPYYDERFYGYGKNKIEYLQHLRLLGYRFEILPEGFLVHNPHVDSRAKLDWNAHKSSLHHDMDHLYPKFLQELLEHPTLEHSRPIVGLCSDKKTKDGQAP